jgi:hypothetical protein
MLIKLHCNQLLAHVSIYRKVGKRSVVWFIFITVCLHIITKDKKELKGVFGLNKCLQILTLKTVIIGEKKNVTKS